MSCLLAALTWRHAPETVFRNVRCHGKVFVLISFVIGLAPSILLIVLACPGSENEHQVFFHEPAISLHSLAFRQGKQVLPAGATQRFLRFIGQQELTRDSSRRHKSAALTISQAREQIQASSNRASEVDQQSAHRKRFVRVFWDVDNLRPGGLAGVRRLASQLHRLAHRLCDGCSSMEIIAYANEKTMSSLGRLQKLLEGENKGLRFVTVPATRQAADASIHADVRSFSNLDLSLQELGEGACKYEKVAVIATGDADMTSDFRAARQRKVWTIVVTHKKPGGGLRAEADATLVWSWDKVARSLSSERATSKVMKAKNAHNVYGAFRYASLATPNAVATLGDALEAILLY